MVEIKNRSGKVCLSAREGAIVAVYGLPDAEPPHAVEVVLENGVRLAISNANLGHVRESVAAQDPEFSGRPVPLDADGLKPEPAGAASRR